MLLIGLVGAAGALGDQFDDSFSIPGTESQQGQDLLSDRFDQTGTYALLSGEAFVATGASLGEILPALSAARLYSMARVRPAASEASRAWRQGRSSG